MIFKKNVASQARKPKGLFGRFLIKMMNKVHAELWKWGLSHVNIKSEYIILDVGCGGGVNVHNFAKIATKGKIYGIDYSELSVKMAKKLNKRFIKEGRVEIKQASVSSLPFEKNTFDVVTGFETYYFWPDLVNDLKGIRNILKSEGILVLICEEYKSKNEALRKVSEEHAKMCNIQIHTPDEFRDFFKKAGFSETKMFEDQEHSWITVIGKK